MVTYRRLTLKEAINQSRTLFPNRPSLAFVGDSAMSYKELSIAIKNTSSLLLTLGVEKGDRVALLGENSPSWGIAYLGITCMGAVVVPILPEFSDVEVAAILNHSQAKAMFITAKLYPKLGKASSSSLLSTILLNNFEVIPPLGAKIERGMGYNQPSSNVNIDFSDIDIPEPMEEDLAAIIYTSGTTGSPKGVMLTHKNLVSNALSTFQIQEISSTDRLVSILPLSHTYECTVGFIMPLMRGASVYYIQKPPTSSVLLPAVQKVKPTMMLVVPLIIEKIFRSKVLPQLTSTQLKAWLYSVPLFRKLLHRIAAKKLLETFGGQLHFFGIGGAKLSFDVERFLFEGRFPYSIGYGMTETSPLLSGSAPSIVKFRCAGFSLPGQEMKIVRNGKDQVEGEVWVRGANVMQGYYRDEEKTAEVITADGWLKTGDLGVIHPNGYLELRGRLKNLIVSPSGENIYPEDIEEVINSHSMVLESLVYEISGKLEAKVLLNYEAIGAKCADFKEIAINMQHDIQEKIANTMEDIRRYANSRVSSFSKLSVVVEQIEPFEKTPTHKIKRFIYLHEMS
ncbi:MAG TPA: AMP-binding protein [Perlabentimonas sp.]|nr:AMP-binding protein [Bacteroidales bacterium]MDD4672142.1 AMP-binding protein [Bacteroidales bacterium]HZJ74246.1 AMP-binding protein [Perlabentimonas sp.]